MNLLKHALEVLVDPESPRGLRDVACSALVAALEEGVATAPGTPMAIWAWIREAAPKRWCGAEFRLGEVPDAAVFASALDALRDPASGSELRRITIDLLSGRAHAPNLDDDKLYDLVDRQHVDPSDLAGLIRCVGSARNLPAELLRAIRDRWFESPLAGTREAAVDVAALMSQPEKSFWVTAAADSSEEVRLAVIHQLVRCSEKRLALEIVRARLDREQVVDVTGELHRAMATLLNRSTAG